MEDDLKGLRELLDAPWIPEAGYGYTASVDVGGTELFFDVSGDELSSWHAYATTVSGEMSFGSQRADHPSATLALKDLLQVISERSQLIAAVAPPQIDRITRARVALGDLGALLAEDGEDVAAELIVNHLREAGVAISWDDGCTLCEGNGLTHRAHGRWVHSVPCPLCGSGESQLTDYMENGFVYSPYVPMVISSSDDPPDQSNQGEGSMEGAQCTCGQGIRLRTLNGDGWYCHVCGETWDDPCERCDNTGRVEVTPDRTLPCCCPHGIGQPDWDDHYAPRWGQLGSPNVVHTRPAVVHVPCTVCGGSGRHESGFACKVCVGGASPKYAEIPIEVAEEVALEQSEGNLVPRTSLPCACGSMQRWSDALQWNCHRCGNEVHAWRDLGTEVVREWDAFVDAQRGDCEACNNGEIPILRGECAECGRRSR